MLWKERPLAATEEEKVPDSSEKNEPVEESPFGRTVAPGFTHGTVPKVSRLRLVVARQGQTVKTGGGLPHDTADHLHNSPLF